MKAAENGDFHGLSKQTFKVMDINPYMYAEGNPVGIKEVLNQKGICSGEVRLPLISASEGLKRDISSVLSQIEA
jgi:4-hydroxy-tetrahydrodipicolinate synthase